MKIARENLISGLVVIALGLVFLSQAFGLEQANATEGIHPMDYPKALTWLFIAVGCCIVLVPSHRRSDSDIPLFSARTAAVSGILVAYALLLDHMGFGVTSFLAACGHRLCDGVAQAAFAAAVEPVRNGRHLVAVLVCPQTPASDGHTVLEEKGPCFGRWRAVRLSDPRRQREGENMLFIDSLLAALSPFTLAMNFVGVMLGMIVGALPGLGSVVAITICLPFTFGMTSVSAIALLLGVYCGSICGGSIAAVLINTPGTPQSAATAFDGYPMARAGKPGKAIGWALAASIFGGVFSCVILTFAAPQIAVFALQFGPLETCALILMGLTCISSVSANNQFKGLAMGVLGLLLACVGMSPFSAESRFTFDIFALNSGIDLVAVIVGVFALSEVLDRVERMRREARVENGTSCRVQLPSLGEWRGRMSGLVKSSLIGTFVGILPGTAPRPPPS